MTVDEYRVKFGWSKQRMAQEASIDVNTLRSAITGKPMYRVKAEKIAQAINRELLRRREETIVYTQLEGVVFVD